MIKITTLINPFLFKYLLTAGAFVYIWGAIASTLTNDDMRDTGVLFFIISLASIILSIIIFKNSGVSIIVLFLFMGGLQLIAFPIFETIGMYGSALVYYMFFQIMLPLCLYLYFNPTVQLIYF